MMAPGMSGVNARICRRSSDERKACWYSQMRDENELEDLLDLNEVMQALGVNEWHNLGPIGSAHSELLSILVEIQGQRYILKEPPNTPASNTTCNPHHLHPFQPYFPKP